MGGDSDLVPSLPSPAGPQPALQGFQAQTLRAFTDPGHPRKAAACGHQPGHMLSASQGLLPILHMGLLGRCLSHPRDISAHLKQSTPAQPWEAVMPWGTMESSPSQREGGRKRGRGTETEREREKVSAVRLP